jgi:hypothetical protein
MIKLKTNVTIDELKPARVLAELDKFELIVSWS